MLVYALPPRILVDISDLSEQHVTDPPDSQKNYLVVDHKTETSAIEEAFDSFTQERKDIAILLINQHVIDTQPGTIARILYSHRT